MEARQETEVVVSPTIKSELGNLARGRRPARLEPAKKAIRRYVKRILKNAILLANNARKETRS